MVNQPLFIVPSFLDSLSDSYTNNVAIHPIKLSILPALSIEIEGKHNVPNTIMFERM